MLYKLFKKIAGPFVLLCLFLRYRNIWEIKSALRRNPNPSMFLIEVYDGFFAKRASWIGYDSCFKGEPCFPHGYFGVFISGSATIGKNAVIFQHVTIGSNSLDLSPGAGAPTLGDNVYIGAGAKIIGNVAIGDNCRIGANAVVYKDMPSNSIAVQAPTRIIQKNNLENRFRTIRGGRNVFFDDGSWVEEL
jgi:serine O-acetyltransferase